MRGWCTGIVQEDWGPSASGGPGSGSRDKRVGHVRACYRTPLWRALLNVALVTKRCRDDIGGVAHLGAGWNKGQLESLAQGRLVECS